MANKEEVRATLAAHDAKVNKAKKPKGTFADIMPAVQRINAAVDAQAQSSSQSNSESFLQQLIRAGAENPLGLNALTVEGLLGQFKKSLLGGKDEASLNAKGKTLLQQGSDIANRLTARINTAAQAANSPGAAAQTRRSQSLLG